MIYIGGERAATYLGRYRVHLWLETPDGEDEILTEPASYEDGMKLLRAASTVRMGGGRVYRGIIVGPVQPGRKEQ